MGDNRANYDPVMVKKVLELYTAKISLNSIGKRLGITREKVTRIIKTRSSIPIRGIGEANRLIMQNRSSAENIRNTQAAHEAVRGRRQPIEEKVKRAKTRQNKLSNVGRNESLLAKLLDKRRIPYTQQFALHIYNLDFRLDELPIAVEVFGHVQRVSNPKWVARFHERSKYLANVGMCQIIVWCENMGINQRGVDKIISICDVFSEDPSSLRKQYVIRGDGKTSTRCCNQLKYLSGVLHRHYS